MFSDSPKYSGRYGSGDHLASNTMTTYRPGADSTASASVASARGSGYENTTLPKRIHCAWGGVPKKGCRNGIVHSLEKKTSVYKTMIIYYYCKLKARRIPYDWEKT